MFGSNDIKRHAFVYILFAFVDSYTLFMKKIAKNIYTFTLLSLMTWAGAATANVPMEAATWYPDLKRVGEASHSIFFVSVYDVNLYQSRKEDNVNLLEFTYYLNLPAKKRIDSTLEKISGMSKYKSAPLDVWKKEMKRIFPNVKKGDTVSVLKTHDNEAVFFYKGKYRGEIADTEFTSAFFDVFLGTQSPHDSMREDLLKNAYYK